MGLALAWRYVNMGDQLDPTGKMPVSPTGKMTRLDLFYDIEFKTR